MVPPSLLPAEPAPTPAWPPTARAQGTELSTFGVLAALVGTVAAELLVFGAAAPAAGRWPFSSAVEAVARQLVLPGALTLGVSMGIVLLLGWSGTAGLRAGRSSPWAVLPVGMFALGSVFVFADVTEWVGPGFLFTLLLGLFLAAAAEEVLFRGFLLSGLARRLDAEIAVFASSWLFAGAHIPALAIARTPLLETSILMLALFGLAVFLCRVRAETGSLWWPTVLHTLWNFVTVGLIVAPFATRRLEGPMGSLKLTLIVFGMVMAFGLARRHRHRVPHPAAPIAAAPPLPAFPVPDSPPLPPPPPVAVPSPVRRAPAASG